MVNSPATAAIYVSGGVPKNYINDSIVMSYIFGLDTGGHKYALQITTDAPHWGGLGGSTLSEATSWGKVSKTATHEMAFVETSVALPLLYGYALQKNAAKGTKAPELHLERRHPPETHARLTGHDRVGRPKGLPYGTEPEKGLRFRVVP